MDLINEIYEWKAKWWLYCEKNKDLPFYKYSVDVLSGWLYYTPIYAIQELAAGQDTKTVLNNRMIGMLAHAAVMRPLGKLRDRLAEKWNVTKDSSFWEQARVNAYGSIPIQAGVYAGILGAGTILSGANDSLEVLTKTWTLGMITGALYSTWYGNVQDNVRNIFGIERAIKEDEHSQKKALIMKILSKAVESERSKMNKKL